MTNNLDADTLIKKAEDAAKAHSDRIDSQYAFQVGYLKGTIRELCAIIECTRMELKRVNQELNSIGEL